MEWKVGQTVQVQSRTWAGINKPGGCAKITKVHYFDSASQEGGDNPCSKGRNIQGLDVKYVVGGGFEKNLDPNLVFLFETLQRGGRKRRGRDFLMERVDEISKKCKSKVEKKTAKNDSKENNGAIKSAKRRILPIKKDRKKENEDPQSTTLSSSGPSSPSANTPPPQPKRRRKVVKPVVPQTKKVVVANKNTKNDVKPMEVVYADRIIEVSPLDRATSRKEKKQSPEVRRGLFESRNKSPADEKKIAAAVQVAASAVASKGHAVTVSAAPTSKQMPQSPIAQKRSSLPNEAAVYETPTQQAQTMSTSSSRHQPLHVAAKATTSAASKLQLPRPPPKDTIKPGKSVPLKRVFENEMQKARQFIDDLVKPREEENDDDDEEEEANDPQQVSSPSHFVQFMAVFNRIRLRMDDGTIEEDDFLKQVNAEAVRPYEKDEIDRFLEKLSEQGKVMKSDGNIYII